uniref:E3 ubiquitin-protein ligase MSL2 n=1 Tax=Mastacembelus armatus TaxID=205130 RepID=A0A3Q3M1R2_9TELE
MNPVNATSLYVSASRSVLQCDPRDPRALAELCRLLPFFRQSLSCVVCGNLLQDPIASINSACQHYVCRGCKGQRMQLKPYCSWCKDYSRFEESRCLSLLVHSYKKLCHYITQSPLAPHIASAASESSDLQAILSDGLMLAESEQEEEDISDSVGLSQTASTSEMVQPNEAPLTKELKREEATPVSINGLHNCNGLVSPDTVTSISIETDGGVVKKENFLEEVPVCVCVTASGESGICDIGPFGDDLKHGEGPLLLSVEEVLRTLATDIDPDLETDLQPECSLSLLQSNLSRSHCTSGPNSSRLIASVSRDNSPHPFQPHRQPSLQLPTQPSTVIPHAPPRCHRKRSHSESDTEKVQPLPISSLLRGSPHCVNTTSHLAPVPNGGPAKVGKTVSNKVLKRTLEHHTANRKACTKVRQGAPKPRLQPRDRVPSHPHVHPLTHAPSPSKPLYKKPVRKKGCKCGRSTQNPSVLTCRGQRCPCYSNRKACLDCICRGCQNSYMANGEKKLEAFAVPEKALEQTRLTLGINLTSIAAAALRSPTTSSPGSTLLNVTTATGAPIPTTFLSGARREKKGL